jgi:hypothetical protein
MRQKRYARIESGSAFADRSEEHIHQLGIVRPTSKRSKSAANEVKTRISQMSG